MRMAGWVYLMMAWYKLLISRRSLRDYVQNRSFHKPISGVHTDPYEESSGVFRVL